MFIMENPNIKWMIWGYPHGLEISISGLWIVASSYPKHDGQFHQKTTQIGDIMLEIVFVVGGWCGCKCWFTLPGAIDSSALGSGSGVNMVGRVSLQTLFLSCALQHTSPILEQHQNLHQHLHQHLNQIGKPVSYEHQIGHIWRGRFFSSWPRSSVMNTAPLGPEHRGPCTCCSLRRRFANGNGFMMGIIIFDNGIITDNHVLS